MHPGVYRSTVTPVTPEQRLLAACLSAGPRSVASHASAAWLWGLLATTRTAPSSACRPRTGRYGAWNCIARRMSTRRVSYRRGIPCTDPAGPVDLAAGRRPPQW